MTLRFPWALALSAAHAACAAGADPEVSLEPVQASAPGSVPLAAVSFMVGCWRGAPDGQGTVIEERYTPPDGDLILGTTRYVRGGQAVGFEFSTLAVRDGDVWLTPYPGGEKSPHDFRFTSAQDGRAVFEAPEHDYPKRIIYQRAGEEGLTARIDGGEADTAPRVWEMAAVPCA